MSTDDTSATRRGSGSNDLLGLAPERESVDDALLIVESYGPWGADLNDAHRRQIVLADEVVRLRGLYEMAVRGRAEMRAALRTEREGYDIMGLAEEQRQKTGPFGGPGTPNAAFGA